MPAKRLLILGFALLSALALVDVVRFGPWLVESSVRSAFPDVEMDSRQRGADTPSFSWEKTVDLGEETAAALEVRNFQGILIVGPSSSGDIEVSHELVVWADNEQAAEAAAQAIAVEWTRRGDAIVLDMVHPRALPKRVYDVQMTLALALPAGVDAAIQSFGSAQIEGVDGSLSVDHRGGHLAVRRVQGDVTAANAMGRTTIEDIQGSLVVRTHMGDLTVRGVEGGVRESFHMIGDADIQDVRGDVEMTVGIVNLRLTRVEGDIDVDAQVGGTPVSVFDPRGNVSVIARYSPIQVFLDEASGWEVDAETNQGRLISDFDLPVQERREGASVRGRIGDGQNEIFLRTGTGNVFIMPLTGNAP